ncbi:hypothetical protein V6N12_049502 [Hibiscus sabdariffa]|uniref:Protein SPIRAL1-like 1 n=1 Tax=Hibiscus sabdariffa TaxID=183260 RepID=A0ABR2CBI6_9ROSI
MGRGVSCGGGQSSLGYLFGSGEAPKPAANNSQAASTEAPAVSKPVLAPAPAPGPAAQPANITKQIPAGINSTSSNNYLRADGQNTGNFITDRPSTKVHAAPGGGSSLNYLFGGGPGDSAPRHLQVTWSVGPTNSAARSCAKPWSAAAEATPPDQKDLATCRTRGQIGPEGPRHLQGARWRGPSGPARPRALQVARSTAAAPLGSAHSS